VEEVIDLEPDQIQPAPRIGTHIRTDFIKGMGKRDNQFVMILDIDRVFSAEDLAAVRQPESGKSAAARRCNQRGGAMWAFMPSVSTKKASPARLSPAVQPNLRGVRHPSEFRQEDHARASHQAAGAQPASEFVRRVLRISVWGARSEG